MDLVRKSFDAKYKYPRFCWLRSASIFPTILIGMFLDDAFESISPSITLGIDPICILI